jgi:hypothetical protein
MMKAQEVEPRGQQGEFEMPQDYTVNSFEILLLIILHCGVQYREQDDQSRERLTTHDALSYLKEVKTQFASNRRVYDK